MSTSWEVTEAYGAESAAAVTPRGRALMMLAEPSPGTIMSRALWASEQVGSPMSGSPGQQNSAL